MYAESHHRTGAHDADEIDDAIRALSEGDFSRLATAARIWFRAFGLDAVARDPYDLVSEAILRTATGRRGWKVGVDFDHHLREVMRSIVDSWRKSAERRSAAGVTEVLESELETEHDPGDEDDEAPGPLHQVLSREPYAESTIIARQGWKACEAHFAEDRVASAVLEGKWLEMTGPETRKRWELTEQQYAAAVRRIRRYADRLTGEGQTDWKGGARGD